LTTAKAFIALASHLDARAQVDGRLAASRRTDADGDRRGAARTDLILRADPA
jgi:hypothetical protein